MNKFTAGDSGGNKFYEPATLRWQSKFWAISSAAFLVLLLSAYAGTQSIPKRPSPPKSSHLSKLASGSTYVGSTACATCHKDIYNNFRQTGMGKSMTVGDDSAFVQLLPVPSTVYDPDIGQYFEVTRKDGSLYQSQYALGSDGKELFRQSWKLAYVVGAGENGYGFIVERDHHLFEAPLSFYSKTRTWSFSPGYEFHNYGFTRPILSRCITCHSGRPQPIATRIGLFKTPPFEELAVGCENCHGPGDSHVKQRQEEQTMGVAPAETADASVVNPARLSPWLADNICMRCHQGQDTRVERSGLGEKDFRPGMELDKVISIFKIAPDPQAAPSSMLLEHYFGMTLSKCYRASAGKLRCISCHDPHVQPTGTAAVDFYKSRCLTCHTQQSCTAAPDKRQATAPPDNCISCHMPKRTVTTITHAALTDHTVPARAVNSSQDLADQPPITKLLHLTAPPDKRESMDDVPPFVLFQAYNNLVRDGHKEFVNKQNSLLDQVAQTTPTDPIVLRALAERAASQNTPEGLRKAISCMSQVARAGSITVDDSLLLADLYSRDKRNQEAVTVLEKAKIADPYFREIYQSLAAQYMLLGKYGDAINVLKTGLELFPDDVHLRALDKTARAATLQGMQP